MSKFRSILNAAKNREPELVNPESLDPEPVLPAAVTTVADGQFPQQAETLAIADSPILSVTPTPKKMGRPKGKRSHPDYEQVTAYIRRDTYTAVKIALLQEGGDRQFSELVQDLLTEYLTTQGAGNPNT
jgi:hypothetical protein